VPCKLPTFCASAYGARKNNTINPISRPGFVEDHFFIIRSLVLTAIELKLKRSLQDLEKALAQPQMAAAKHYTTRELPQTPSPPQALLQVPRLLGHFLPAVKSKLLF
jgi:hypothetical protein